MKQFILAGIIGLTATTASAQKTDDFTCSMLMTATAAQAASIMFWPFAVGTGIAYGALRCHGWWTEQDGYHGGLLKFMRKTSNTKKIKDDFHKLNKEFEKAGESINKNEGIRK